MENGTETSSDVASNRTPKQEVLVVDDDRAFRFHVRLALEALGLAVTDVESGEESLTELKKKTFSLVLVDVRMPGINGFETCRRMRQHAEDDHLPIILMTSYDDLDSIEYAYHVGATDFTTKPINWPILKIRIRHLIKTRYVSQNLKFSEANRQALLDSIPDTILQVNSQGRILFIRHSLDNSATALDHLAQGSFLNEVLSADLSERIMRSIDTVLSLSVPQQFEFAIPERDRNLHFEARIVATAFGEVVVILRNFTERYASEELVRRLAFYDSSTGLPNLSYFTKHYVDTLAKPAQTSELIGVLRPELVDIDHITAVLGANHGASLIKLWVERLTDAINHLHPHHDEAANPLIARVNESGFAVTLDNFRNEFELKQFLDVIERRMSDAFHVGEYDLTPGCRIGVASCPHGNKNVESLLEKADLALDEIRKAGRLGVNYYSATTRERTLGRVAMKQELTRAVEQGDLHVHYQPKVRASDGQLIGVEALVRWDSPHRGPVSPVEFIPLAEESSLILTLGEFVLTEACKQSKHWKEAGCTPVPIAVNLSGHQFNQRNLIYTIQQTLNRYDVASHLIEVEVTESVAINNEEQVKKVLRNLKELGIRTAIDDFGTGHSSLASLRNFPFDILKIDHSFIKGLGTIHASEPIIEAIIKMGVSLNLEIVSEGVENEFQLEFLKEKGCHVIQGFLTGIPMPGASIVKIIKNRVELEPERSAGEYK